MSKRTIDEGKMIMSLGNQISAQAIQIAERDALIQDIGQELHDARDELEKVQAERIAEMNVEDAK